MKVEIVSVGTQLLMSDILDTSTPYVSRVLREAHIPLTCKVSVGDDPQMIADVLQVALNRADIVLAIGSAEDQIDPLTRQAAAEVTGRDLLAETPGISGASLLGGPEAHKAGLLIEENGRALICLPGNRREMAYLLDNEVLPYIQKRLAAGGTTGRVLLRTVDIMESSLKQLLAELSVTTKHRITYDSFAGQTSIQLWAEGASASQVSADLAKLKQEVINRLGDHIYGQGDDRLENVVLEGLRRSGRQLAIAECSTNGILVRTLSRFPDFGQLIQAIPATTYDEMTRILDLEPLSPQPDLSKWCQSAAERLLANMGCDLGLVVCKHVTQGGVQVVVSLASPHGVSVTRRSFGGHPENIDQWALTLGLAHLRRWLLVHH